MWFIMFVEMERNTMDYKLHDRDIREPLFDYLEERNSKSRILEEIEIGKSRADVVMVLPKRIVGIEIKSDADTYERLNRQVKDYNKYFDENYLVVGSTHAMQCSKHIPLWWGIISVEIVDDKYLDFYVVREASPNPKSVLKNKIKLLWRPELYSIQMRHSMFKYKEKSKAFVQEKILEVIDSDILNEEISEELFERDYTTIAEEIERFKKNRRR